MYSTLKTKINLVFMPNISIEFCNVTVNTEL
jgi:hypothetical protein